MFGQMLSDSKVAVKPSSSKKNRPPVNRKTFVILMVVPDIRTDVHIHLGSIFEGVAYLSTYLKNAGFSVELFAPKSVEEAQELEEVVRRTKPGLIGISVTSCSFKHGREYATRIKAMHPEMPIICGGIHAILAPDDVMKHPDFDIVALGEGEELLVEVAERVIYKEGFNDVEGIWFRKNGELIKNPKRDLPYMDGMPFPDLDLFNVRKSFYHKNKFGTLKLSRGCPYLCTYCNNPNLLDTLKDRKKFSRLRSPQNALEHVQEYLERYPYIETLAFLDDIIFINRQWFREFMALYKKHIGLPYAVRGRCNLFDEEIAALLKDTGCYEITFGVEAGDDYIRNDVLYRKMSKKTIIDAFQLAKKYGMTTRANNMVGNPYETVNAIFETVFLNAKLDYKVSLTCVFFPFRGSPLYDLCKKEGFLQTEEVSDAPFNNESMLNYPNLSRRQIYYFRLWFDALVWISKTFPVSNKFVRWLHNQRFYPYEPMIFIYQGWRWLEKMTYKLQMKMGIQIQRFASKPTGQVEKLAVEKLAMGEN